MTSTSARGLAASMAAHALLVALVLASPPPPPKAQSSTFAVELVRPPPLPQPAQPSMEPPPPLARPAPSAIRATRRVIEHVEPPLPTADAAQSDEQAASPPPEAPSTASPTPARRMTGVSFAATVKGGAGAFPVGTSHDLDSDGAGATPAGAVGVVPPRRIFEPKAEYPPLLKRSGVEGDVVVEVTVGIDGRVTSVVVVTPAQRSAFNDAAIAAAKAARYEPATHGAVPVPYAIRFTVHFRLRDAS